METYTFENMADKTLEGVKTETSKGLVVIASYFKQTLGIDLDIFNVMLMEKAPTDADKVRFYMNFRNEHPELFYK